MSKDYFASYEERKLLSRHGLDGFQALWELKLDAVDAPNTSRGGWSSVYRLELEDADGQKYGYFLKRQDNHLTRSLRKPLGEPTFAREYRAIRDYARDRVPALEAVFFAQREHSGHRRALLLTRALDDYQPLDYWLDNWSGLPLEQKTILLRAAAQVVRKLHRARKVHRCLYPKHLFIRLDGDQALGRLIDLEKTRRAWLGRHDLISDLATLSRRTCQPSRTQRLRFLLAYLDKPGMDAGVRHWVGQIQRRIRQKASN